MDRLASEVDVAVPRTLYAAAVRDSPARRVFVVAAALALAACGGGGEAPPPTQPTATMSPQARAYLEEVLVPLQAHSLNRLTVDWPGFRTTLFAQATGAQTTAATHPAIGVAVGRLGDGHSSFRSANGFAHTPRTRTCFASSASLPAIPPNGVVQQRASLPYRLRRPRPKVAVLIDGAVASSGEAVAIAFRGRPDTRAFGTSTCGLSTAVEQYPMSDGATLNLAISVMADRAKTKYGHAVAPDEVVSEPAQVVDRAVAWLQFGG
jgi:hypothetical protein